MTALCSLSTLLVLADVPDDYVDQCRRSGMTDREIAERISTFSGRPRREVEDAMERAA
jgi:hypothetical protein